MNTGAFGEGFPYTNFHDLNMDWIIKIAKDFLDQYTHIQEIIEQGKTDIQTLTDSGIEQIGDLTATSLQDLQDKADALQELLQEWYNSHSEDIADQLADALADLNDWYTEHSQDITNALNSALEEFAVRAEQKALETIETIPSDYTTVANKVEMILPNLFPSFYFRSFIEGYGVNGNTGAVSGSSTYSISTDIKVVPNSNLRVYNYSDSNHAKFGVAVYDSA